MPSFYEPEALADFLRRGSASASVSITHKVAANCGSRPVKPDGRQFYLEIQGVELVEQRIQLIWLAVRFCRHCIEGRRRGATR